MPSHLRADSAAERQAALAALAESAAPPGPDALSGLEECLGDSRKSVQRRAAETSATLLTRFPALRSWLDAVLTGPELRRRWGAIFALSLIGSVPDTARPTLLELLGEGDGDVRWAAADLLKRMAADGRVAVVADLLAAVREVPGRRKMALYCLRDLGVAEANEVVETGLADADVDTRLAALAVLAAVGADRAAAARRIAALVDDPDQRMQRAAAGTLGNLGIRSREVEAALDRAVNSTDESLRKAARRSLGMLPLPRGRGEG